VFKTSVATKVISLAVLLTLLLASIPTAAASAAKTNNRGLEAKWTKLVETYNRQTLIHEGASRRVAQWLEDHRRAPASQKAEVQEDLAKANKAWAPVPLLVMRHSGFDANGKVIDKAAAQQSIKDLSRALQRYTASMKNLNAFLRQYK
jgi:hypothetical protein